MESEYHPGYLSDSDAGVPGSITGSAICFHLYFFVIYVFIPPIPTTWPSLIRHLYLIISPDRVNFCHVCLWERILSILRGRNVVVPARWTVDYSLGCSMVEHLTSDARVPGSIPAPAICIHFTSISFLYLICEFLFVSLYMFIPPITT